MKNEEKIKERLETMKNKPSNEWGFTIDGGVIGYMEAIEWVLRDD